MNELSTNLFEESEVRIVNHDGEILFVGADVCKALGFKNDSDAMQRHCRGVVKRYPITDALGRQQEVRVLTEPDVFRLITHSKKEKAQRFEKWVFEDVLPSIRRTGSYTVHQTSANHINGANMQRLLDIMQNFSEIAHENARLSERNCYLSQFEPRSEYGDANADGIPCYQKRRGYFVSRKGADVVKQNPEKETFEQLDLFYDRLPGILLKTFKQTLNELTEGK